MGTESDYLCVIHLTLLNGECIAVKGKTVPQGVALSCWGLTESQILSLVIHESHFICVQFSKDMGWVHQRWERGDWENIPLPNYQKEPGSGMVQSDGLGPSGNQPLLGHLVCDYGQEMKSLSNFALRYIL